VLPTRPRVGFCFGGLVDGEDGEKGARARVYLPGVAVSAICVGLVRVWF
jgi:hypothetical protein